MITFTGDPIYLGDKQIFDNSTNLLIDSKRRNDASIIATVYAEVSGEVVHLFETAYTEATVNAVSVTETSIVGKFHQAIHELEKARLEGLNPANTFTITL